MSTRIERIRELLTSALAPVELDVIDESHLHVGHEGAKSGGGHFRVRVVAAAFQGKLPLARHRMVYSALESMLPSEIHALSMQTDAPSATTNQS